MKIVEPRALFLAPTSVKAFNIIDLTFHSIKLNSLNYLDYHEDRGTAALFLNPELTGLPPFRVAPVVAREVFFTFGP